MYRHDLLCTALACRALSEKLPSLIIRSQRLRGDD